MHDRCGMTAAWKIDGVTACTVWDLCASLCEVSMTLHRIPKVVIDSCMDNGSDIRNNRQS